MFGLVGNKLNVKDLGAFEVAFKTLEFTENIFDFVGFWMDLLTEKDNKIMK